MADSSTGGPDRRVVAAAAQWLPRDGLTVTPSAGVAEQLMQAGLDVEVAAVDDVVRPPDALVLLDDEVSTAGDHAEGLLARTVAAVRPGGLVAVSAIGAVTADVRGDDVRGRPFRADELSRALGHLGVEVDLVCAPGAAALLGGRPDGSYDAKFDRLPGLVDAGPRVLVGGRAPASMAQRSQQFFATLPYKVVAAAVVCRDTDGRLLVVHDSFKGHWTIPGGVVDADEDPRSAAQREAWEEAGVRVRAGRTLGVFSASWPDRIVLVYEATPAEPVTVGHEAVHAHEIDAVDWWPLDEALQRLAPHVAEQVRHCLDDPGGTLRQHRS